MTHFKWSRFIRSRFGREISAKQMKNKDNQKQRRWNETECFWLQFSGVIMKFRGFTTISPSHSLFSSYTSAWHEMKASMKRANRRRWVDVVVWSQSVCFGLLCARVRVCVHACMFECVRMCVCFETSLAPIPAFSVQHLPPPYCCWIRVQDGSPVGPEKWDCTSISLAATGLEVLLS